MDARRIEQGKTLVSRNTTPIILSDVDRKTLEKRYVDLLLKYTHTTPRSSERLKLREEINDLASQLGKSKKKVTADIRHYEQAKKGGATIREDLSNLGVYSPYWKDYFD